MVLTVTLKEGAREMVEDDASRDTVIPTAHGQARMSERAVSIEELQRAKMYGTIRAGDRVRYIAAREREAGTYCRGCGPVVFTGGPTPAGGREAWEAFGRPQRGLQGILGPTEKPGPRRPLRRDDDRRPLALAGLARPPARIQVEAARARRVVVTNPFPKLTMDSPVVLPRAPRMRRRPLARARQFPREAH